MFIVTHKPELAIWITDNPLDKKSGVWNFYDNVDEYNIDLDFFKNKYGSKLMMTLKSLEKNVKNVLDKYDI